MAKTADSVGGVTVLVLCKDNPEQLNDTLISVIHGAQGLDDQLEVLVVDGSMSGTCADLCQRWIKSDQSWFFHHHRQQSQGIYAALNEGIGIAQGQLLACMNSGDAYCPGGLTSLVNHWKRIRARAQAPTCSVWTGLVEAADGLTWLSPASTVRNLSRWLHLMVPRHQALLFDMALARHHLYPLNSPVADRGDEGGIDPSVSIRHLPQPVRYFR